MSWSGTVRCGWCHEEGHNKRTCERYKKYLDKYSDKPYIASEIEDRKTTKCSFCTGAGHNKRTCEVKTKQKAALEVWDNESAKALSVLCSKLGIGRGAMVRTETGWNEWGTGVVVGLVCDGFDHSYVSFLGEEPKLLVALPNGEKRPAWAPHIDEDKKKEVLGSIRSIQLRDKVETILRHWGYTRTTMVAPSYQPVEATRVERTALVKYKESENDKFLEKVRSATEKAKWLREELV